MVISSSEPSPERNPYSAVTPDAQSLFIYLWYKWTFALVEFPKTIPFPALLRVSVVFQANLQCSALQFCLSPLAPESGYWISVMEGVPWSSYPVSLLVKSPTPLFTLLGTSLGSVGSQMASADHRKGTPSLAGYLQPWKHLERNLASPGSAQWEFLQSL